jgi:hypothetical protein
MNDQGHLVNRRNLLRWLGAAALIVPAALSACAYSTPPRESSGRAATLPPRTGRMGEMVAGISVTATVDTDEWPSGQCE